MSINVQSERVGRFPPWVWHEHMARFRFASRFVKGKVVVDCACGEGFGSQLFGEREAKLVAGFDLSMSAIVKLRSERPARAVALGVCDALTLPLRADAADVFIALETVEHVDDPKRFIEEVARVLKREGTFICSTPNRTVTNPGKKISDHPWNRFHVQEFDQIEFLQLLESRFERVALHAQNPKSRLMARLLTAIGRIMPGHTAVRVAQFAKLPALLFDKPEYHEVRELVPGALYEYLVAVCSGPRSPDRS